MPDFEQTIMVREEDLDDLNHVNNVRYVQWIQDIAKAHWQSLAPEALRKSVAWVVMHHDITYKSAARLNDELRLVTYIEKNRGAVSVRIVEIFDGKTNALLVRSSTKWCLLNAETFKPMRIPEAIMTIFKRN
ncbi:MAG: acyl-CoA thioesterase [Flavobacteriales bacterium]|nr:MAG: acyl-CoA thioesterase [Flavobacteriales bacterium]